MLSRISCTPYGGIRTRSVSDVTSPGAMPALRQCRWKNGISQPRATVARKRFSCSAWSSSRDITNVVRK